MNKTLVLLTASFPYGSSETFLETEINYLCRDFERMVIVSCDVTSAEKRSVPENCEVQRLNITHSKFLQVKSITNLLHPLYKEEKKIIKDVYQKKFNQSIQKTMLVSLERAKRVAEFLEKQNFDYKTTVFYSYWCDDTALGLALLKKEKPQIKAVSRMHRWDIYFEESTINYLPFRYFIYSQLNNIVSISQDGIDYAIKHWKVEGAKFVLSRLGINEQNQLAITKNVVFHIVSCSNIIPVKRVDLLAKALKNSVNTQIHWTHFGDGVAKDKVMTIIANFPDNIHVDFKGRVPNQEVFQFYRNNTPHLFVNVSSSEGVPVSIMEAMSFGIPVLATDVGGNGEIVTPISSTTQNGFLLSENPTIEEISEQIERFIKMAKDEYQAYSDNAYQTWKEKYNAEKNYSEFVSLLRAL